MEGQVTGPVGREAELAGLGAFLGDAVAGRGSTVFLSGEAGVGKSRLVDAFRGGVAGAEVLAGAAEAHSPRPFQVLSRALGGIIERPLFEERELKRFVKIFAVNRAGLLVAQASSEEGELDGDIFAGMLSAVQDFVRDSFTRQGESSRLGRLEYGDMKILMEHGQHLFLTAVIKGAEHPDMKGAMERGLRAIEEGNGSLLENWKGKMSELEPVQAEIDRMAEAGFLVRKSLEGVTLENERIRIAGDVLEALRRRAREKPVALMLEDLHWADESSLFVISYLARNIKDIPVMLLGTLRPGESQALESAMEGMRAEGTLEEMSLGRLGREHTRALMDETLAPNDFPDTLAQRLYEQSKGNPLFVVEMLRGMHDDGSIELREGRYTLVSETYHVPATVEDVVNHRLGALDREAMGMIEYVSCIGQSFDMGLAGSNTMVGDPGASLDMLVSAGILLRSNGSLEFAHAVFRSVVYDGLGDRWKAGHHRNIGEHLEAAHADSMDGVMYELARHFSMTREHGKCMGYCIRAGEMAESSFAAEQALNFYNDAMGAMSRLGMPESSEGCLDLLERCGDLQSLKGSYGAAVESYMTARAVSGDRGIGARMLRKVGEVRERMGEYQQSLEALDGAVALMGDGTAEQGRIILAQGITNWRMGEYESALALFSRSVEMARGADSARRDMGNALRAMGIIRNSMGQYDESIPYLTGSLEAMEAAQDQYGIANALHCLGTVYCNMARFDESMEHFRRSLELKERIGDRQGIAMSLNNMGNVHADKGEPARALEFYGRSLGMLEEMGDSKGVANALNNIGLLHYDGGNLDMALEFLARSAGIKERIGNRPGVASSLGNMGRVHADRGDLDLAEETYRRSLAIQEEIGDRKGMAGTQNNIGLVQMAREDPDRALDALNRSFATCEEIGDRRLSVNPLSGLAEAHLLKGDLQAARIHAARALAVAVELGTRPEEAMGLRVSGMVHREAGDLEKASGEFERAEAILTEIDEKVELARLRYERAILWKARGDKPRAAEHMKMALAEFQRMGMRLWAEKCSKVLEGLG